MTATKYQDTLIEFDQKLNAFARREMGFAQTVTNLAHVRARMSVITDRRKEVFDVVKAWHAEGQQTSVPGIELRQTKPAEMSRVRAVPAGVIKKRDPKLWAASRVVKPRVSVKPPKFAAAAIRDAAVLAVGPLPACADGASLDEAVIAYRSMPGMGELKEHEQKYIDHLKLCATIGQWDGLPIEFRDGWEFGLSSLQYDSERLRVIAPGLWEQLAVDSERGGNSRVIVGKIGADDLDGDADSE